MKRHFTKTKKTVIFTVAAVLAMSVTVLAASQTLFNRVDTRIIEGEEYVNEFMVKVSEDGTESIMVMDLDPDAGVVVAEIDGETMVIRDELVLTNLAEAQEIFALDRFMVPEYLPEGFQFAEATFFVNPLAHDQEGADGQLSVGFSDGENTIQIITTAWDENFGGIPIFGPQEDVVINGHPGAVAEGSVSVLADGVLYTVSPVYPLRLESDVLLRIAESLR